MNVLSQTKLQELTHEQTYTPQHKHELMGTSSRLHPHTENSQIILMESSELSYCKTSNVPLIQKVQNNKRLLLEELTAQFSTLSQEYHFISSQVKIMSLIYLQNYFKLYLFKQKCQLSRGLMYKTFSGFHPKSVRTHKRHASVFIFVKPCIRAQNSIIKPSQRWIVRT